MSLAVAMVRPMLAWARCAGFAAVVLITAASACTSASARSPAASGSSEGTHVPVTKVTDGDTIHVTFQGQDERVRLIGIDTPEVPWYGGQGDCFGVEAALFARRRLSGRSIRLAFDVDRRDRYGRLLAYVYLGDQLFNLTLVRLGYARADPVPPDIRRAPEFARAEAQARMAGRGLWSACPLEGHG
jgi:micrococcal nuclease